MSSRETIASDELREMSDEDLSAYTHDEMHACWTCGKAMDIDLQRQHHAKWLRAIAEEHRRRAHVFAKYRYVEHAKSEYDVAASLSAQARDVEITIMAGG